MGAALGFALAQFLCAQAYAEHLGEEGDATFELLAGEHLDTGRLGVEDLRHPVASREPRHDVVRHRAESGRIGARQPDGEARRRHDAFSVVPGKRPGRKITFRSFTTS